MGHRRHKESFTRHCIKGGPLRHYTLLKGLQEAGFVDHISSGQNDYARLTKSGRVKANSYKLEAKSSLVNPTWDNKWRIILLDLPESRKSEREALRYLLKKAGFVMLKNSAWISPYPFEHLFTNIKRSRPFDRDDDYLN